VTGHADASPSSSSIWLRCPASVTLARGRQRRPTQYTREGTAAHEVAERLIHGLKIPDEIVVDGEAVEVTDEMVEHVEVYVGYVDRLRRKSDVFLTEASLSINGFAEPLHGTADALAYEQKNKTLEIVDLKYGQGVQVVVQGNPQLRIYGLGGLDMMERFPVKDVKMTVIQPRSSGPSIDSETIDAIALKLWAFEELGPALLDLAAGRNDEIPGPHCRWCVRAGECKALSKVTQALARQAFAPDPVKVAHGLSNDELSAFLDKADLVSAWIGLVRAEASHRADLGQTIPGWKLVPKRAMRKWTDEDDALAALSKAGLPWVDITKAVSPAAVERVLKTNRLGLDIVKPFIKQESSGTTLVRDSDPREESLALSPKSVFTAVE
jgi:hypothetical protein